MGLLTRLRQSTLAGNTAALYGAHLVGLVVPLVTIPYLARILRPEGWGRVVFAQAFAAWLTLLAEYAFDLSGTRAVARAVGDDAPLSGIAARIQGAKVLTGLAAIILGVLAYLVVPVFRSDPALFVATLWFALARGLSPYWYFQGIEEMKAATWLEAGGRALAALGVFLWVMEPGHEWRVLALQALMTSASTAMMSTLMYSEIEFEIPTFSQAVETLRHGVGVFFFRAASGVYGQASSFILGLLAAPATVAFFGGAEKIVRAAVNLLHPLTQAIYPRLSRLVVSDTDQARRVLRIVAWAMGGLGVLMGGTALAGAELLVDLLLGPGYEAAVPVVRVLSLLPPVIAIGGILGLQWALPFGLEEEFSRLVVLAACANILLAVTLVPPFGAVGMAIAVVLSEVIVSVGLVLLYIRRNEALWTSRRASAQPFS